MRWLWLVLIVAFIAVTPFNGGKAQAESKIGSCKVYKNYVGTSAGDWLIVLMYDTDIEDCDMDENQWWVTLINNNTGAPLYTTILRACGHRPGCMYLSEETVSPFEWQGNYSVKIEGMFSPSPSATYNLKANDWASSVTWLNTWVITQAKALGLADNGSAGEWTYVDPTTTTDKLNNLGGPMFSLGIDSLQILHPELFSISQNYITPDYGAPAGNHSYEDQLASNWETSLGPEISGLWIDVGDYFNLSGRVIGIILIGVGFLALATYTKTIAFGILLGGVVIEVFPMAIVIIACALLFFVFVRAFFLSST